MLVVHEWWGMGPYAKRRAEMLAKLGYVAFAADMYGKGVASFHGGLGTPMPAEKGTLKAKILVLNGADDSWVQGDAPAFIEEMRMAGADYRIVNYGGAVHSFTVQEAGNDPYTGMAYNADADRRSWEALKDFLSEIFK